VEIKIGKRVDMVDMVDAKRPGPSRMSRMSTLFPILILAENIKLRPLLLIQFSLVPLFLGL
jgi:hypothetical protein